MHLFLTQKEENIQPIKSSIERDRIGIQVKIGKEILGIYLTMLYESPGPDGLHPTIFKELAGIISEPFSVTFQSSCSTGKILEECKRADVVLIYKKKKIDPKNYKWTG